MPTLVAADVRADVLGAVGGQHGASCLFEFDVPPEMGLSRAKASAAFRKHGLNPRSFGSWVQGRYLAREDDRRWLLDGGRRWADDKVADPRVRAALEQNAAWVLSRIGGGFNMFGPSSAQPPSASRPAARRPAADDAATAAGVIEAAAIDPLQDVTP